MKSIAFIAAAAAVATVSAQADEGRLFYSSPISSTVWTAGKNETVSWTNVCRSENTRPLDIVLYLGTGAKNGTEQVRVPNLLPIGTLNCLTSKSATVFLPANLTTSDKYAINGVAPPTSAVPPTAAPATSSSGSANPSQTSTVPAGGKSESGAGSLKVVGSTVAVVAAAFGALLL
ncbi:hypothetical protein BGZ81_004079 [Podila clonocystis]|nr:hypothetical protein BGZ81_004079 [Podila clonocystis]